MKDIREIYQALLDGKTLVNKKNTLLILENSSVLCIGDPEQWSICDEWKMKPAGWSVINTGVIGRDITEEITLTQKFGMKYHTEEAAKNAIKEMREANLLRYWASVFDSDWKADWENEKQNKYYIYKTKYKDYAYAYNWMENTIGAIYMSEKTADKICEALNSGDLVIGDK